MAAGSETLPGDFVWETVEITRGDRRIRWLQRHQPDDTRGDCYGTTPPVVGVWVGATRIMATEVALLHRQARTDAARRARKPNGAAP